MGTDGYFQDPVLRQIKASHLAVNPNERALGKRVRHFSGSSSGRRSLLGLNKRGK